MPRVVYLDTGPLGLACHPSPDKYREAGDFRAWLEEATKNRLRIIIPAIADYELRRELTRNRSWEAIAELDRVESGRHPKFAGVLYLPLADSALKRAAELWAEARNKGFATAGEKALDGDVIIAAQVLENAGPASRFMVATGNVGDIARYVGTRRAKLWADIIP